MKRILLIVFILSLNPIRMLAADITPPHTWVVETDVADPPPHDFGIRRSEDLKIRPTFTSKRLAMDLISATSVVLVYSDGSGSCYAKTGAVYSARGGIVEIPWTGADCTAGDYVSYEILVQSPNGVLGRGYGTITLMPGVGDNLVPWRPTEIQEIDWASVLHKHPEAFPFTHVQQTVSVTGGVAFVNSRLATTNYVVHVTNGTWNGSTAVLETNGVLTILADRPVARFEYSKSVSGITLAERVQTGDVWFAHTLRTINRPDVVAVRLDAGISTAPPLPGDPTTTSITISNLNMWSWVANRAGETNDFAGFKMRVDDADDPLAPVNLRTMDDAIQSVIERSDVKNWRLYGADGKAYYGDGINLAGLPLRMNDNYDFISSNNLFCLSFDLGYDAMTGRAALRHNGRDLLYATASGSALHVDSFWVQPDMVVIGVSTSGVTTAPWVEYTASLSAPAWATIQATSTYPASSNGAYYLQFAKDYDHGFFRAMQAGTNVDRVVTTVPFEPKAGILMGGILYTNLTAGSGGGESGGGTGGGIGNFTNLIIAGNSNTNQADIRAGSNVTITLSNGAYYVNATVVSGQASTGTIYFVVDGVTIGRVDSNGITIVKGSLQLYEDDLNCNVRIYDGSRYAPSLTLQGHPGEIGMYGRPYGGKWGLGFSYATNEVVLIYDGGIRLLSTNASYYGKFNGDAASLTNVPEPQFAGWITNGSVASVTVTNGGMITGKDAANNTKFYLDASTGDIISKGQNLDQRYVMVNTNWPSFVETNVMLNGKTNIKWFANGYVTNRLVL